MRRRQVMFAAPWLAAAGPAAAAEPALRLATAWRVPTPPGADDDEGHQAGVLRVDWQAGRIEVEAAVPLPTRAHGLLALGAAGDDGFVVVANRPGRWLLRCDAQGRVLRLHGLDAERPASTLNGHAVASADRRWLYTSETDAASGEGRIGVRDAATLQRVATFDSHGPDPHQLLPAADGSLLVANGGIARDARGRKLPGQTLRSSLVRIDPRRGALLGQWRLADPQLSLRHLAWSVGDTPLLGVAMQAEHESAAAKAQAPLLALWDGRILDVPAVGDTAGGGYAGDIAAAPAGGFVLSAQKRGRCLWWAPDQPASMRVIADLTEPCALASSVDGHAVFIGAGRGLARWHASQAPRMLRWPLPLAPDNHAVRLDL